MKKVKIEMGEYDLKIIFKQPENNVNSSAIALEEFGILQCFLKQIVSKRDKTNITRKRHYHKCVEVHIIENGYQIYEIEGKSIKLEKGSFLIISPLSYHCLTEEANETEKYSFTFDLKRNGMAEQLLTEMGSYFSCVTPVTVRVCIAYIKEEKRERKPYHALLICNRVLECILQMLRLLPSAVAEKTVEELEEERLTLAKQYIGDNICNSISVDELADYCHIGKKQLTRIFLCGEGCTAAEYVRRARCLHIEKLLADPSQTLSGISEEMHFCNQYYFNTYFKRYSGMTPGAYRRSVLGTQ